MTLGIGILSNLKGGEGDRGGKGNGIEISILRYLRAAKAVPAGYDSQILCATRSDVLVHRVID